MNLHALVAPVIAAVNPPVKAEWLASRGYGQSPDFKQVPQYANPVTVWVQDQALSGADLKHMDGMNIQGVMRAIYMNGNVQGADRPDARGGDLLKFKGYTWLVTQVLEPWSDSAGWTKVAVTRQMAN